MAMKDASILRRKRAKLKLVVSFNCAFQRQLPSGKLRYTGGEARILSVDRAISFSRLKSKISELLFQTGDCVSSFSLEYRLPEEIANGEGTGTVVCLQSDDDVRCMIDEFERVEVLAKHSRLWLFVCNENLCKFYDGEVVKDRVSMGNMETLGAGVYVLCRRRNGVGRTGVEGLENCRNLLSNFWKSERYKMFSDDTLRKIVLREQLFGKISDPVGCSGGVSEQSEMEFINENDTEGDLVTEVASSPENPSNLHLRNLNSSGDPYRVALLDYEYKNSHVLGSENFDVISSPSLTNSRPLNLKYGNLCLGFNSFTHGSPEPASTALVNGDRTSSPERLLSCNSHMHSVFNCIDFKSDFRNVNPAANNLNRKNIMAVDSDPIKNGFAPDSGGDPLVGSIYQIRSSRDNERMWGRKYNSNYNNRFGLTEAIDKRIFPCEISKLNEVGNPHNFRLERTLSIGKFYPSLASKSIVKEQGQAMKLDFPSSQNPWSGPRSQKEDLAGTVEHGLDNQLMNQQKVVKVTPFLRCPCLRGRTRLGCSNRSEASCKTLSNCQNGAQALQDGIACASELPLKNMPISSSPKGLEISSVRNSIPTALREPEPEHSDPMDGEHANSAAQIEKSNIVTSDPFWHGTAKKEINDDQEVEIQQDPRSNVNMDEKIEDKGMKGCLRATCVIRAEIAAFYTHVASSGLQRINNSDLEYIKELGSGTYGTVYYGKWKGSDVAIKRIRSSCFTDNATDEDRLVSNFWKEAHMLGQLHHPNIVALYGVVTDGPVNILATVTEYMVNGSLKQVLKRKDRTIDRQKRLIIAMNAAFGIEYLHEKKIVHFDLKSHNFLVNMRDPQRPVCKIGDLGLSKFKQRTLVSGGVRGTIPWMAPELLNSRSMVTEKVDVYSFGIVMWELLTGEEPYSDMRTEEIIAGIIHGNLRPDVPCWCDPTWRSLMERCWSSDPDVRPAFSEIAKQLRAMAAAMNIK